MTSFGDLGRNYRVGGGVSSAYLFSKEDQIPVSSPKKASKETSKPAVEEMKPEDKPAEATPKPVNPLLGDKDLSNNPFVTRNTTI
jgi:hypothetical protein